MTSRAPLVSINIPCYHQLAEARRCVETVLAQSFGDFELTLLDDGASDEYRDYVDVARRSARALPPQPGAPRRDAQHVPGDRRGHAASTRSPFTRTTCSAALPGDGRRDPRAPPVVRLRRRRAARVHATSRRRGARAPRPAIRPSTCSTSPADFLRAILGGIEPMFGSVVYRRDALAAASRRSRRVRHAGRSAVPALDPATLVGRGAARSARLVPPPRRHRRATTG